MMPLLCLDSSNRPTSYYKTNINMKYAVKSITSQPRYARYEKIEYNSQFTPDEPMPNQQPFFDPQASAHVSSYTPPNTLATPSSMQPSNIKL